MKLADRELKHPVYYTLSRPVCGWQVRWCFSAACCVCVCAFVSLSARSRPLHSRCRPLTRVRPAPKPYRCNCTRNNERRSPNGRIAAMFILSQCSSHQVDLIGWHMWSICARESFVPITGQVNAMVGTCDLCARSSGLANTMQLVSDATIFSTESHLTCRMVLYEWQRRLHLGQCWEQLT